MSSKRNLVVFLSMRARKVYLLMYQQDTLKHTLLYHVQGDTFSHGRSSDDIIFSRSSLLLLLGLLGLGLFLQLLVGLELTLLLEFGDFGNEPGQSAPQTQRNDEQHHGVDVQSVPDEEKQR